MRIRNCLAPFVAFALLALAPIAAMATSTVHIEWLKNGFVYSSQTLSVGATAVASAAAPANGVAVQARITVLGGAVVYTSGPSAVVTQTSGTRIQAGWPPDLRTAGSGDVVSLIEATDPPGPKPTASTAAESCHVFKASPGLVYSLGGYVGQAGYIMVFDAAAAPADGAVTPKAWGYAGAAGNWSASYGAAGAWFAAGVTVCDSSTGPLSKTAVSTNNVFSGVVQ